MDIPPNPEPPLEPVAPGDLLALICRFLTRRAPPPPAPLLRRAFVRGVALPGSSLSRRAPACRRRCRRSASSCSWTGGAGWSASSWGCGGRRGRGRLACVVVVVGVGVFGASWSSCRSGWAHARARACAGFRSRAAASRAGRRVDRRGQRGEVLFGFQQRGFGRVQLPSPLSAARATASKSLCSGPALAVGISPLPELPQATSRAARAEQRGDQQARRQARAAGMWRADGLRERHVGRARSLPYSRRSASESGSRAARIAAAAPAMS